MSKRKRKPRFPKVSGRMSELGITQGELVDMLRKEGYSISRTSICKKLAGDVTMTYDDIRYISIVLCTTPEILFFEELYTKCKLKNSEVS